MICGFLLLIMSSCSHCCKDALHETECCGRAYCGQECLEADLAEHDLECVDLKLPQWMRRKQSEQVIIFPNKIHTTVYFYNTKRARDNAYSRYQQSKNQNDLKVGSVNERPIERGKKYERYIQNRPGFMIVF